MQERRMALDEGGQDLGFDVIVEPRVFERGTSPLNPLCPNTGGPIDRWVCSDCSSPCHDVEG